LKLLGDIALAEGHISEAQAFFQRANELAKKCGMRPLMALCSVSLTNCQMRHAL
jgi:hypothetical protein